MYFDYDVNNDRGQGCLVSILDQESWMDGVGIHDVWKIGGPINVFIRLLKSC